MRLDGLDELLDRLEPGPFRAVAPASQVGLRRGGGGQVVEAVEVITPTRRPGGLQLHRGAGQPGQLLALLDAEVRVVLQPAVSAALELGAGLGLGPPNLIDSFVGLRDHVITVEDDLWLMPSGRGHLDAVFPVGVLRLGTQMLVDALDERRAHVAADPLDLGRWLTAVNF